MPASLMPNAHADRRRTIRKLRRKMFNRVRLVVVLVVISLLVAATPVGRGTMKPVETHGISLVHQQEHSPITTRVIRSLRNGVALISSWLPNYLFSKSSAHISSAGSPAGAYLMSAPPLIDSPTNLTVTAAANTQITLSWTAPAGAVDHYQVERSESISGPFLFLANVPGTTHNDQSVSNNRAYLYRVRAITSGGFPSAPSNMAFGTTVSFEFSALQGKEIRAQHFYDIRTAVNAVRALANLPAASWARATLVGLEVKADDVSELRNALEAALLALQVTSTAYEDSSLTPGTTLIRGIHIEQLQTRSTRGSSISFGPIDSDSSTARLDPRNQTGGGGENPLSRNFNWNLPPVSLPGRAGLDLGLNLSYNSLVWTRFGNVVSFDDDKGFPAPGFRLGLPVIQPLYYNSEVGTYAYLLISSDGSRTELRQVGTSALFEAADSSHLLLDTSLTLPAPDNGKFVLRTTDGTKLWYEWKGDAYKCTQIKDRNGNYLTINYTPAGEIDTIIDTLNRTIMFNYVNGLLDTITQVWKQGTANQRTHTWASFAYTDVTFQTNFTGLTVVGQANGTMRKMLSKVTLADNSTTPSNNSRFEFAYTSWGQVWKISNFAADNHLLNYRSYNLPQTNSPAQTDCPRFTERRDWAENWNRSGTPAPGYMLPTGTEEEVVTTFTPPQASTANVPGQSPQSATVVQITNADQTFGKIYYLGTSGTDSGWRVGLPFLVESYDVGGSIPQRQVVTTWTQDDETSLFVINPRVSETNVYDPSGNRKRTEIVYQPHVLGNGMTCQLPEDIREYDANASSVLRTTRTIYEDNAAYLSRRIIGLPKDRSVYEGLAPSGILRSKLEFKYDDPGSIEGTELPVQHDGAGFGASFVVGRGNLTSVKRFDVENTSQFTTTSSKYNRAGSVVSSKDAEEHEVTLSYTDAFAAVGDTPDAPRPFVTLAYPTTINDADSYSSKFRYNYDFGAQTWKQTPQPNVITNTPGPIQTFTYDVIGRLVRTTSLTNNAFTRYNYGPNYVETFSSINTIVETANEGHTLQVFDGHGKVIATAGDHPNSTPPRPTPTGDFSAQLILYDQMGRVRKRSNPTETTISLGTAINPSQFAPLGDDAIANGGFGWKYVEQTYDWKGRPLVTTNQDGTTKTAEYTGCGCAGGEVVTLTDEGTFVGTTKKRQQKIYSDVLGRTWKTEVLNWDGPGEFSTNGSVYSTTVTTFNARDQVTQIRQYQGTDSSPTFQDTTMSYDGYGRLETRHVPEQNAGANTVWTYNADDTINTITDARGAVTTFGNSSQPFGYNNRHQPTIVTYAAPSGISVPAAVSFSYDGAGNRKSMTDGLGSLDYSYDQLSRLTVETRIFSVGTYSINYSYNLANQLTSLTDPFGASFAYERDAQGQLKAVTGSPYAGFTNYVTDVSYRASGAPKSVSYTGSNSTIGYNARMQPTQFRLTGASIIREDYSYFGDGSIASLTDLDDTSGTNPPATLRFLSRQYNYDHVGRVTGGHGNGAAGQGVPYNQSYSYDEFGNMKGRSGIYYSYNSNPFGSDTASYTNNRRSGWNYNFEGQVTSTPASSTDSPRTMSYDAAGRMITTIETGSSGNITYSATYDGDGQLVKESSNTSSSSETSYIVRSTVLGEVLTRLDQSGNKKITHVPAEGLLFATQRNTPGIGANVLTTYRNPLGITETNKAVYDPLGNYIPFQAWADPRPPAGSYNSGSMGGLSSSQANPESLAIGCIMDGLPTNCNRVANAVNKGLAKSLEIIGKGNSGVAAAMTAGFIPEVRTQQVRGNFPDPLDEGNAFTFNVDVVDSVAFVPGDHTGFTQNPTTPQNPQQPQQQQPQACDPYFFNANQTFTISGDPNKRSFTGSDLNYAARVVFAESSSVTSGLGDQLNRERDAIASVLYNRIGRVGFPDRTARTTFQAVANAPNAFESVTGGAAYEVKFNSSAPGRYQNLQEERVNSRGQVYGGECNDLRASVDAIRRLVELGSKYGYTSNRGGTRGPGTVIGGSRFW